MVGSQMSDAWRGGLRSIWKLGNRSGRAIQTSTFPPIDKLKVFPNTPCSETIFHEDLLALRDASILHEPSHDWGPEYDVIKAAFDPLFYFGQNADILRQGLDPVGHFIRAGARENRNPTPWFSTAEYRRTYLTKTGEPTSKTVNPFYHYLTVGHAAGHAPRAPANYRVFCGSIGMTPAQTTDLVTKCMVDVRERLVSGKLGEMAAKAAALDPLIAESWRAALRVRVPPASNAIGVRRIGHLVDLQGQAEIRTARAVIVVDSEQLIASGGDGAKIIEQVIDQVSARETLIIVTGDAQFVGGLNHAVRVVTFESAMPKAKDYSSARTLVEFIRSVQPDVVINLGSRLMNTALRAQGRAVATSSVVYQYVPFDAVLKKSKGQLGSSFYRAIDLRLQVIVSNATARDYLVETFSLSERDSAKIWIAQAAAPPFEKINVAVDSDHD